MSLPAPHCFFRLFLPLIIYILCIFSFVFLPLCASGSKTWMLKLFSKGFNYWLTANCDCHFSRAPLLPCQLAPRLQSRARSSLMCVCSVCSVRSHDDPVCTAGRDWSCQAEARRAAATSRHSCGRQCFWFLHYWTERNGRLVRTVRRPPAKADGTRSSSLREGPVLTENR